MKKGRELFDDLQEVSTKNEKSRFCFVLWSKEMW